MMSNRTRISPDELPTTLHPRAAQHSCCAISDAMARRWNALTRLLRGARYADELDWLAEQAAAVVGEAEPAPRVRHLSPPAQPRHRRSEPKYRRRQFGPTNHSGKARS